MTHTDEGGDIEYDKTTAVHPLTLIREVKKYELLYNKQLLGYGDAARKEEIWDNIHRTLFPNYEHLSEDTKNVIKRTVRKRWKSLRDALVKDQRMRNENIDRRSKKQNPLVKEMQFLVPFIRTPRLKFRDLENNDSYMYDDGNHSPDFCKLMNDTTIDLTFQEEPDDSQVQIDDYDDIVSSEALYPSVRLTTSESESGEVEWKNGFCVSTTNELKTSTLNYTIQEIEESESGQPDQSMAAVADDEMYPPSKKYRPDSEYEFHSKIIDLIDRCNTESQDEDRMFLLSLLSDFKRVPVQKKLKVKTAFVMALANALD